MLDFRRRTMLTLPVLLAVIIIAAVCGSLYGCGKEQPETPATALAFQIQPEYLADLAFDEQQRLFWDYYTYSVMENGKYIGHNSELRFMPEFAYPALPGWEQACRLLVDLSPYWQDAAGYVCWNAADLQRAADILLPGYTVPPEDNGWVYYHPAEGGREAYYQAVGWDANGAVYYRLNAPVTQTAGVYTASFTGYDVGELWQETPDFAPAENNGSKLCRIAKERGIDPYDWDLRAEMPGLIDAGELSPCEEITVTFRLSGDADLPLSYMSGERTELATN